MHKIKSTRGSGCVWPVTHGGIGEVRVNERENKSKWVSNF